MGKSVKNMSKRDINLKLTRLGQERAGILRKGGDTTHVDQAIKKIKDQSVATKASLIEATPSPVPGSSKYQ